MPYKIMNFGPKKYGVVNAITGKVHSSHATLINAERQLRLLNAIDHGFVPTLGRAGRVSQRARYI
jgi:hypothetical protein